MMQLELIKNFFPQGIRENALFQKYMLKEYIQLLILDFLSTTPVPPHGVLCSLKIAAMLFRRKGRDFYDAMFLLAQTQPDYSFLAKKLNIYNLEKLKTMVSKTLNAVDLNIKKRNFEHSLFNKRNGERILSIGDFVRDL